MDNESNVGMHQIFATKQAHQLVAESGAHVKLRSIPKKSFIGANYYYYYFDIIIRIAFGCYLEHLFGITISVAASEPIIHILTNSLGRPTVIARIEYKQY